MRMGARPRQPFTLSVYQPAYSGKNCEGTRKSVHIYTHIDNTANKRRAALLSPVTVSIRRFLSFSVPAILAVKWCVYPLNASIRLHMDVGGPPLVEQK